MKFKKIKLFSIIILPLMLTGCWNYRELNDLAIVSAIGVGYENEDYKITFQIMNAKKESSDGSSSNSGTMPINVITSKGKTMHEALRRAILVSPKRLYIGHTNLLVIDENVARDGIVDIIDFLIREPESRKQFKVLIAKNTDAEDVLSLITPLENLPAVDILNTIKVIAKNVGVITEITFDELLSHLLSEGIEVVIPTIYITGDIEEGKSTENNMSAAPKASILINQLGVFGEGKLLGYLNEDDSFGYNLIRNNVTYSIVPFKCDKDNYASIEIVDLKSSFKVKIIDDKPIVEIELAGQAFQSEVNCDIDMNTLKGRQEVTDGMNNELIKIMTNAINTVKHDFGSDIFGFGRYIYRNNNKYWEKNKDNWNELFKNIDFEITSDFKLAKKGSTLQSIKVYKG